MEKKRYGKRPIKTAGEPSPLRAIRNSYAEEGVQGFYLQHGDRYHNPHFPYITQLLQQNVTNIDYDKVLDFCCGSGEVSQVLHDLGFPNSEGCDPFTQRAYSLRMEKPCLGHSFGDVIKGKLGTKQYTSIICSFAMHLCPPKRLYPLVQQLFEATQQLVIITPHKRPALEKFDGIRLAFEDFVLTERGKKVRLKSYAFEY